MPKAVGPVRSFRATDLGIVAPARAVLVASGGAPPTVRRVREAEIRTFTEGAPGYFRASSRPSPYDLFINLPKLAKTLRPSGVPGAYLPWGPEEDFPSGRRATGLQARFSAGHTTTWQYRDGTYVNVGGHAADRDRFEPRTVLVLRVQVGDAGYLDPAGNPVPETKLAGQGQALVFHGGKVVRGTWTKSGIRGSVKLKDESGQLTLPPGKVWMELVPATGGNVGIDR